MRNWCGFSMFYTVEAHEFVEVNTKTELLRLNGVREFYLSVYGNRLRLRPGTARPDRKSVTLLRG